MRAASGRVVRAASSLAAIALAVAAGVALSAQRSRPPSPDEATLRALQAQDDRVNAVAWKLTTGAAALCPVRQPSVGIALHTLDAYRGRYRRAAAQLWGLREGVAGVASVAPGSPAAAAGLAADAVVTAIDGRPVPRPARGQIGSVVAQDALTQALADGQVTLTLADGRQVTVAARPACASRFEVTDDADDLVGQADGRVVQLSQALVGIADTEDGLAAVLAHELAHNVLEHRARLRAEPAPRRARLAWSRAFEIEADRFSLRLLDAAGYAPAAAVDFWAGYARRYARDVSGRGTHPDWEARLAAMRREAQVIARRPAAD